MRFAEGQWHDFTIVLDGGEQVRLDDVGVIWYRRPSTHHAPGTTPTESLTRFILEMNPFGQWAWVQDLCGLPIAEAHCRLYRMLVDGSFHYAC